MLVEFVSVFSFPSICVQTRRMCKFDVIDVEVYMESGEKFAEFSVVMFGSEKERES